MQGEALSMGEVGAADVEAVAEDPLLLPLPANRARIATVMADQPPVSAGTTPWPAEIPRPRTAGRPLS